MKRSDINEPILLQSKENRTEDYISLSFMLLLAGFGLYNFIANRDVSLLAICLLYFVFQFYMMYRGDIFITRKAIYKRTGYKTYQIYLFSDLSYSVFEDTDAVYLVFGVKDIRDIHITNDRQKFEELKKYLIKVSQDNLPHHGYVIAERAEIKRSDELGCIECQGRFSYLDVKQWNAVVTKLLFKKIHTEFPICPNCRKKQSVVLSQSAPITASGLNSMKALRS